MVPPINADRSKFYTCNKLLEIFRNKFSLTQLIYNRRYTYNKLHLLLAYQVPNFNKTCKN